MVIAFPPGGPTDFVGRLLADKLKELLGQSVIIENKAGANGAIGADAVAKSEPDGYTLFFTTVGAVAITPNLRNDMPYDTMRDFAPVSLVVNNTTVLVVQPEPAGELGQGPRRHGQGQARHPRLRVHRRSAACRTSRSSFISRRRASSSCTCPIGARRPR